MAASVLVLVSACSTDVEYLRAGTIPAGSGGSDPSGSGGTGGAGGSATEDASDGAEPDSGSGQGGAGGSEPEGGTADAPDTEPPVPTGIQVGLPVQSEILSPSTGGMNFTDQCATTSGVMIGVKGTVDPPGTTGLTYLKSFTVVCGTLGISNQSNPEVTTTVVGPLPSRGMQPGTTTQERMCPTNQVVVGFDSKAAMYVDQLVFRCAQLVLTKGASGYGLSIGMSSAIGNIGGDGGNLQRPISCPDGSIAIGSILRAGNAIDAFSLGCAVPSLKYGP
jgi:hypothetical protein